MTWIQTRSGNAVDLADPDWRTIDFRDVTHALGAIPRYNGHARVHYPVDEHCCHIAYALYRDFKDRNLALAGLLHDSPEAYLGDISSPMYAAMGEDAKRAIKAMHACMWGAIATAFDIDRAVVNINDARVREYDLRILLDERAVLFDAPPKPWGHVEGLTPLGVSLSMFGAGYAPEGLWPSLYEALRAKEPDTWLKLTGLEA